MACKIKYTRSKKFEEIQTDDVQQIADLIISEAIDNDYGKEKDDMTVIVAKISK